MNSLRGIFDNDRPVSKRNFIQENMRQLRCMKKVLNKKEKNVEPPRKLNKFQHIVAKVPAHVTSSVNARQKEVPSQTVERTKRNGAPTRTTVNSTIPPQSTNTRSGPLSRRTWTKTVPVPARKHRVHPVSAGNQSSAVGSEYSNKALSHGALSQNNVNTVTESMLALSLSRTPSEDMKDRNDTLRRAVSENSISVEPVRSLGCQTVCPDDVESLFNEGVIKYPSICNLSTAWAEPSSKSGRPRPPTHDSAQQTESSMQTPMLLLETDTTFQNLNPPNNDIRQNLRLKNMHLVPQSNHERLQQQVRDTSADVQKYQSTTSASPKRSNSVKKDHNRGTHVNGLPHLSQNFNGTCLPLQKTDESDGSLFPGDPVPLPEAERLQTLRILQKSYEDHIRQLNSLPVKTDTLRMRLRKIDIEKQLDKLEEGIKVFSRPKVFVKIGV